MHIARASVSHVCIFWTLHQFNVTSFYSCLFHFLLDGVNLIFLQNIPAHDNCYGGNLNAWISLNHNILLDQRVHFNRKCSWEITRHALSKYQNTPKNVMPSPVSCDSQLLLGQSRLTQKILCHALGLVTAARYFFLLKNSAWYFFWTRSTCSIFFLGFPQPPHQKSNGPPLRRSCLSQVSSSPLLVKFSIEWLAFLM